MAFQPTPPVVKTWLLSGAVERNMDSMAKRRVSIGDTVSVRAPHSEVCMHMQVAGKEMNVVLLSPWQAQLVDKETGKNVSFPITPGEAGIMTDTFGFYIPF